MQLLIDFIVTNYWYRSILYKTSHLCNG